MGWIDGVRKSLDERCYVIRFTPRRARSIWSAVNLKRVAALTADGRMRPQGLAAFAAREAKRTAVYAYENRPRPLEGPYAAALRRHRAAWGFFQAQPPWYQRAVSSWVMTAKKEETRQRRLDTLIATSAAGQRLGAVYAGGQKADSRGQNNAGGSKKTPTRSASAKGAAKRPRKPRARG